MMTLSESDNSSKLAVDLLKEAFGEEAAEIGKALVPWRTLPLHRISLDRTKRKILALLIQHRLIFFLEDGNRVEYGLDRVSVHRLLRYPRYLYAVKSSLGDGAETIFEEIFISGRTSASKAIKKAGERLKDSASLITLENLLDSFKSLISLRFIRRTGDESTSFDFPDKLVSLKDLQTKSEGSRSSFEDDNVLWELNPNGFHGLFARQIISSSCARRFDSASGLLLKIILEQRSQKELSPHPSTPSIQFHEIKSLVESLEENPIKSRLVQFLSQYLSCITDDCTRFLDRVGDSGGGEYSVNLKTLFEKLAYSTFDNIVLEKFGSKALRIFRVICSQKRVEESSLVNLVMIPAKETKLLTYKLMENHFIQLQELRKSVSSNTISKGFYLFYVDPLSVARMVRELCFKAIGNCISRKNYEFSTHQRLIDKQERMDSIVDNLKNSKGEDEEEIKIQIQEVYEMLSPAERDTVKKIHNVLDKLTLAAGQIDETLFLMDMYLYYNSQ